MFADFFFNYIKSDGVKPEESTGKWDRGTLWPFATRAIDARAKEHDRENKRLNISLYGTRKRKRKTGGVVDVRRRTFVRATVRRRQNKKTTVSVFTRRLRGDGTFLKRLRIYFRGPTSPGNGGTTWRSSLLDVSRMSTVRRQCRLPDASSESKRSIEARAEKREKKERVERKEFRKRTGQV